MPAVHHNLANLLFLSGKVDEAIQSYTTCLEQDLKCADAWYNLGNAFSSKHDHPKAIKAFKTSLSHDKTNAQCHFNLGNAYFQQKEYSLAIQHYLGSLEANETDSAHLNLAIAYSDIGQSEDAIKHLEQCIELNPNNEDALSVLI